MKVRLRLRTALALSLVLFLQGCWSLRDARDLTLASAIGVDLVDGRQVKFVAELVNPKITGGIAGGGETENPTRVLYSIGTSPFDALRRMDTTIGKSVFPGEAQVFLLGKKLAETSATLALDFVTRQHQLRRTISLVVTEHDIGEVLATRIIRDTSSQEIVGLMANGRFTGYTANISANTFLADMSLPGIEPVAPVVELIDLQQAGAGGDQQGQGDRAQGAQAQGQKRPKAMQMNTLALFQHNRMVGILGPSETRGLLLLRNKLQDMIINVPAPGGGFTSVEAIRIKSSIKPHGKDQASLSYEITLNTTVEIADVPVLAEDVGSLQRVKQIEDHVARDLEIAAAGAIRKLQNEFGVDSVGFGLALYRQNPRLWFELSDRWPDVFRTVPWTVRANVRVRSSGTVFTGIKAREQGK